MKAWIDGTMEAEQESLGVGPVRRKAMERSVYGLDGAVSVDAGRRSREITQRLSVRAMDGRMLDERIGRFEALADGKEHVLELTDGRRFAALRADAVHVRERRVGGSAQAVVEIQWTQLREE